MTYFLRFTFNPQADLKRNYSFVGYELHDTQEAALKNLAKNELVWYEDDFDFNVWMEDNEDRVGRDNVTGLWGTTHAGLCGFGSFASIQDAQDYLADYRTQPVHQGLYDFGNNAVIFEGHSIANHTHDEGALFHAERIVWTE